MRRQEQGYSLIEIMVALVVFAIGVMGLAGIIPMATQSLNHGANATRAQNFAETKLEELENASGEIDLPGGTRADTLAGGYVRRWTVSPDTPISGMTTIAVQVSWSEAGEDRQVVLTTSLPSGGN